MDAWIEPQESLLVSMTLGRAVWAVREGLSGSRGPADGGLGRGESATGNVEDIIASWSMHMQMRRV